MASPVKAPLGENESPGPLSSMKFGSAEREDRTEKLDPNVTHDNQPNYHDMSGIFSKTFEHQQQMGNTND